MGEELRGELMSSLVGTNGRDLRTKTAKATNADATPTYFPTSIPTYYPTALGDGDYDYSKSKSGKGEVCFEYDPCDPTTYPDGAAKVEGEAADSNSVKARGKTKKADYEYDYDYDYDEAGKSGKSGNKSGKSGSYPFCPCGGSGSKSGNSGNKSGKSGNKSGKSGSPEDFECDLSCLPTPTA